MGGADAPAHAPFTLTLSPHPNPNPNLNPNPNPNPNPNQVRMARLTHLLSQPERQAANASLAASVEAREATRVAVAHHQPQLLQQPARLSRALARQAWPAAPASAARLQLLLELLLDSERRQRQQRKESAAAAAAAGTAPAASSPPPPAGLLDHNATLLLALRAAVRYLGLVSIAPAP